MARTETAASDGFSRADRVMTAATIVAAIFDHIFDGHALAAIYAAQGLREGASIKLRSREVPVVNNPLLPKTDGSSPVTQAYLNNRRFKRIMAAGTSLLGNVTIPLAGPNVPGIVMHGQATALSGMHLLGIERIARENPLAPNVADWCALIRRLKWMKVATRGQQLAGSAITAFSTVGTVNAAVAKGAIKVTYTAACLATAAEIHHQAHLELPNPLMAAGKPRRGSERIGVGPASRIMTEIFTKRGGTRLFGAYDVAALIREPAGWQALGDKLSLI